MPRLPLGEGFDMIERLTLPGGQWIDVKLRLKVKDDRQMHSFSVDGVSADGKTYRFNAVKHAIAHAAARIMAWDGFKDDGDKPLLYPAARSFEDRLGVIESLYEEDFDAITKALNERFKKQDESEKNDQAGNASS